MNVRRAMSTKATRTRNALHGRLAVNILVAAAFGCVGIVLLLTSHADTPTGAVEPEVGTITSPATSIPDTSASGGSAIQFNAGPTSSTDCPAFPQFPDASCTGVPTGVALTQVSGDQIITTAGTVIDGKDIHGYLTIKAKNVVVRNSIIRGGTSRCAAGVIDNHAVITIDPTLGSATLNHIEINPANPNACLDGISASNVTITNADIHGTTDGIKAADNTTLQDSIVHDLAYNLVDPNHSNSPTHNDAVQTFAANKNISLVHNSLDTGPNGNAAYIVSQDLGQPAVNMLVQNNSIHAGGCSVQLQRSSGPAIVSQMSIIDNYFYHAYKDDCPIWLNNAPNGLAANSGNVWIDTHQPIPAPF